MNPSINIGSRKISYQENPLVIAEIGINHNGDIDLAKKLIKLSSENNFDAVKFQKRDIYTVYSKDQLETPRESPWGNTTEDQKKGLELSQKDYEIIDQYCKELNIKWKV